MFFIGEFLPWQNSSIPIYQKSMLKFFYSPEIPIDPLFLGSLKINCLEEQEKLLEQRAELIGQRVDWSLRK